MNYILFVPNSAALATRVKLEILRAVAKKCSNSNEEMFVFGFHIQACSAGEKEGWGPVIFVDLIVRYRGRVKEADLGLAYKKAGGSFKGQMQQNFMKG